jgi:hypothetical protein
MDGDNIWDVKRGTTQGELPIPPVFLGLKEEIE